MALWKRRKRGGGSDEPPKDKQPAVQPQIEPTQWVSWDELELTSEEVARTNQVLSANYGKKVTLNATKLDTSITKLQLELHNRGFDIKVTSHFALQVMTEESRRVYNKVIPEYPWAIALVIEAERRIRTEKGYAESYALQPEEIDAKIGEMKKEAVGQSDINRVAKLASDSPQQSIGMEELKKKLLEEAQHLARMDMARKKHGLKEGAKLPSGVLKEFLSVKVPRDDMKVYFEIAKKKYYAMHGLD